MFEGNEYAYRVFISYSHSETDRDTVAKLAKHLHDVNVLPVWDRHNLGGGRFDDSIRKRIGHPLPGLPLDSASFLLY